MKSSHVLLVTLVALVGVTIADIRVNQWADGVFSSMRSVSAQKGLEPMNMAPFNFKIKKTGITNRDVKAAFLQGTLNGLSFLQRYGDCANGTQGGDYVIGCNVLLTPIVVQMNADVKGDVITGVTKHINTQSNVAANTYALIEFHGTRSGFSTYVYKTPITVRAITLASQITGPTKLDLNTKRMTSFIEAMNKEISLQINNALTSYYQTAITDVAKSQAMP